MSIEMLDFGCRLNLAEGASIARRYADADDLILVNSCAVTAEASRQVRQAIRRAARRRPEARIVVTGCGAATERALYAAMPEVTSVIDKQHLRDDAPAVSGPGHARAFVEVQNGCDHDCSFCVTTLARGAARSLGSAAIVAAVAGAVARGHREVVLTGVDLTSYRPGLASLVATILRDVPTLPRLRLSSLDPSEVDDRLIGLFASEARLMPHVHLSLQSGDSIILKRMKRRHAPEQAIGLVERLRAARPGLTIGADLIAGFPTETELAHANSVSIIAACDIAFGHIFPYSPRPGTAAARMPQLEPGLAQSRAAVLRAHVQERRDALHATMLGTLQPVLVERDGRRGHAPNFASVDLRDGVPPGTIVDVMIDGVVGDRLFGHAP